MNCRCVRCGECGGSGYVWFAFPGEGTGRYLGKHRSDDLDEMEPCNECGGKGITEVCEHCQEAEYELFDY